MLLDSTTSGLFPIAPTPFHPDGRVDYGSVDTLVERLRTHATHIRVPRLRL
jgi:4-hydroxy-tetrahydrodipicolinate synthase